MAYSPPALGSTVTLACPYTAPALAVEVVLCGASGAVLILAGLSADLTTAPPTLLAAASGGSVLNASAAGAMLPVAPGLGASWGLSLDLALPQTDGAKAAAPRRDGLPTSVGSALLVAGAARSALEASLEHAESSRNQRHLSAPATERAGLSAWLDLLAADAIRLRGFAHAPCQESARTAKSSSVSQQGGEISRGRTTVAQADLVRSRTRRRVDARHGDATALWLSAHSRDGLGVLRRLQPAQTEARRPLPGRWWPRYEAPPLTLRLCCLAAAPGLDVPVVLSWDYSAWPRCPGVEPPDPDTPVVVPVQRVYYVLNSVSLKRVSDGVEVPCDSLSLDLSASDWAWSFQATVPGYAEALLRGESPVALQAMVNGEPIRLVVRSVQRSREFAKASLSVSGLGRAAELADPQARSISRMNTEARTAAQLLDDSLTENGVSIGWSVDWQIEDWSVQAGYWSHTGTYIEAATRLAEAGGGYVQAHDVQRILRVLPWYKLAPWDWASATPDIVLPEDACKVEGIEWLSKTPVNAVWITGGTRRDRIKRTGSAGDIQAQTIVDQLATDPVMTRQRGLKVLAEGGDQALITLSLPVLDEVGIIRPGQLIRYSEQGKTHLGMSRAVSVSCGFPEVWQSIKLEVHA